MGEEKSFPSKPSVFLEREEGGTTCKMSFNDEEKEESGIHHLFERAASPVPSYVSLKSDRSMAEPPKFSHEAEHLQPR